MLPGLMQDFPLNIIDILRFAGAAHGVREIVSRNVDEPLTRLDYARAWQRVGQAAQALGRLGVVSPLTPALAALGKAEAQDIIWPRQGRMMFDIEMKIVDELGNRLPHDGKASGVPKGFDQNGPGLRRQALSRRPPQVKMDIFLRRASLN